MNTKTNDKIDKEKLLNCTHIKNLVCEDKKLKFNILVTTTHIDDLALSNPARNELSITCPDIDKISFSSFTPREYKGLNIGQWINGLIKREKDKLEAYPKKNNSTESLMEKCAKMYLEEHNNTESDKILLDFGQLAIKTIKEILTSK
jgi:hypothetical protein